jgi:hypothetical protein
MTSTVTNNVKAAALIALALAIGATGIYVADADDAPGAAVIGLLLMIGAVVLGVKAARNRLPAWAARTALAVGVLRRRHQGPFAPEADRRASEYHGGRIYSETTSDTCPEQG